MEFTLDVARVRDILARERARVSEDIPRLGVLGAVAGSRERHDGRIASAADVATLACGEGCTWCCHFTVDVHAAEVFAILDHVAENFAPAEQTRLFAQVHENSLQLQALGEGERVTRNIQCPFLQGSRCSIYPVRPQSCRNYHATDAAGCRQSFEEPENLDIDPEFAPEVYQAGAAHIEAVSAALSAAGFDVLAYELNAALDAARQDGTARERFLAGKPPFTALHGEEVEPQFDDLCPP